MCTILNVCSVCGLEKSIKNMHIDAKLNHTICAECFEHYRKVCSILSKAEHVRERNRLRARSDKVLKQRQIYRNSEKGKLVNNRSKQKWLENNKEKREAHNKVAYAVKSGVLVKPTQCSKCNLEGKIIAHHEDYSQPLKITWLCTSCHTSLHMEKKKE